MDQSRYAGRNAACSRPAGMSMPGLLLLIVTLILVGMLALKMIPAYLQYFAVDDVITGLAEDERLKNGRAHPRQIRDLINKRLRINGVYQFDPDNIEIEKTREETKIRVAYEVREHFLANVYVVMSFKSQVDL